MSVLKGKKCIVRSLLPEDRDARVRYLNLREVERMMLTLSTPYTDAHHDKFLEKLRKDDSLFVRAIEVQGELAGGIGLHDVVRHHKGTLGYWLAPQYWGKGIMSEAISLFVEEAFRALPLARIQAYVFAHNPASGRVLEKLGFLCEGRLRKDVMKDGQIIDRFIYSKLCP